MAGHAMFHVEFGINETDLTTMLERGDWEGAEKMITRNTNPTFLSEGSYERTPLNIVLSGVSPPGSRLTRNLFLAKLLVQRGANTTARVPERSFGSEYLSPGKTAAELVVDWYNVLTMTDCIKNEEDSLLWSWNPIHTQVIGTNKEILLLQHDLVNQLLELMIIIIGFGTDLDIKDKQGMTPLHRTAIYSNDSRMLEILCESVANVNSVDMYGNTALACMCAAFPLQLAGFLDQNPEGDPYSGCCSLSSRGGALDVLLQHRHIDLNVQNNRGWTALFHCMLRGDTVSALKLLRLGCDTSLQGRLKTMQGEERIVSPLFAALCSLRVLPSHSDRYLAFRPKSYQFIAHLVDAGYFSNSTIENELHSMIEDLFPDFQHLKRIQSNLLCRLFGGTSCTLRQLAVRSIFQSSFINRTSLVKDLFPPNEFPVQAYALDTLFHADEYEVYLTKCLDIDVLERMLTLCGLPKTFLVLFEVELFRQQLLSKVKSYYWFRHYDEDIDGDFIPYSDSDEVTSEDDSDLEYW